MNPIYPDRITLEEQQTIEVKAQFVHIKLLIEGESSVFSDEALKKSKNLSELIFHLKKINYPEECIVLDNVSLTTQSGKLLSASTVKFSVSLTKINLPLLPSVLDVLAKQKHITVTSLHYDFGKLQQEKTALMREVCLSLKQQAQDIGLALGVSILGIYSLSPRWQYPTQGERQYAGEFSANKTSTLSKTRNLAFDLDIAANKKGKLTLSVNAEFRISEFADKPLSY